jgi:hypothetical protein
MTTYRWVTYKQVTNAQGTFKMSWDNSQHWEPSDNVIFRERDGSVIWLINEPLGSLIKYPCGTKRFIKYEQ